MNTLWDLEDSHFGIQKVGCFSSGDAKTIIEHHEDHVWISIFKHDFLSFLEGRRLN